MNKTDIVFDLETTGLDPLKDRIIAIGIKTSDAEVILEDKDERKVLQAFWTFLRAAGYFRLIGFNSNAFDTPFLIIRSLKHGVETVDVRGKSVDLRLLFFYGQRFKNGTLDSFSTLIGVEGKPEGVTGADVPVMYEHGELEEIKKYLLQDIRITWQLLRRAVEVKLL